MWFYIIHFFFSFHRAYLIALVEVEELNAHSWETIVFTDTRKRWRLGLGGEFHVFYGTLARIGMEQSNSEPVGRTASTSSRFYTAAEHGGTSFFLRLQLESPNRVILARAGWSVADELRVHGSFPPRSQTLGKVASRGSVEHQASPSRRDNVTSRKVSS